MPDQVSETELGVGERVANCAAFEGTAGPRTLAERAFAMLHDAIVNGVLRPGERLPIEDLASALGMSPMPIREALRRLDGVGLVENVPHRGARVAELTVEDLKEVYDARLVLELPAISKAAEIFTEEDDINAKEWLSQLEAAIRRDNRIEALRAHTGFHFALYRASSSRWLVRLISPLWDSAERYRVAAIGGSLGLFEARGDEHERLLAACRERLPEVAAAELWNHLSQTANQIAVQMGEPELYELKQVPAPTERI